MKDKFKEDAIKYFNGEISENELYKYYFEDLFKQTESNRKTIKFLLHILLFVLGILLGMVLINLR